MTATFQLQAEAPGEIAAARRRRASRSGFIAKTWSLWFCWSMWMPDEPTWSQCGMIWKYRGEAGKHLFGAN